jgi:hypothetical protein
MNTSRDDHLTPSYRARPRPGAIHVTLDRPRPAVNRQTVAPSRRRFDIRRDPEA